MSNSNIKSNSTIHSGGATHNESEDNMRKIFAILLAVMLITSMAVSAYAVTPKWEYKPVKLPEIKVSVKIPNNVFDNWFKEHPLNIKLPIT